MSDSFDFSSLFDEFRDEAQGQLARLDAALLRIEDEGDLPEADRSALLRSLHTLKGNSGMLGLTRVVDGVHALESVFKSPPGEWSQALLDSLFEAAAALRRVAERVGTDEQEEAVLRLERVEIPSTEGSARSPAATAPESAPRPPPAAEEPEEPEEPSEVDPASEVLRVRFSMLDQLLNQVGELVAAGAALDDLLEDHAAELETAGVRRLLQERGEALVRLTASVRRTTMDLRLVPVGRVLSRFPSLARDLARQQGKQVKVELHGEEVELDKGTVDALGEPLLHLVRNAVDHGIHIPREREAQGKPPTGTLTLRAERSGDRVRIEVSDDGTGLSRERILARARQMGLVGPGETPPPGQLEELIFAPGFSTRSEATTVSGRGIGLEVVRSRVAALRGSLSVNSRPGEGTRFVLRLPLTLAVIPALLFESAGETLAIATAEVEETLRGFASERAGGAEVVRHRGELLPMARTAELFGWRGADARGSDGFAIVVRQGARSAAVLADRLLEQRDVMVKALPRYLGSLPTVSGVGVAPTGRPLLLLDVGGVMDLNLTSHRRARRAESR